jgi:hypothetical protein
MSKRVGSLGIEIAVNDAELRAAMKRAADSTTQAFTKMEGAASKAGSVLAGLGVAVGAIGLATTAFNKFAGAITQLDDLNDLSKRTAVSVETLGALKIAAEQSGTSLEGLAIGLKRLQKAQIAAADGDKAMQATLSVLGVTARDPERALIQLAAAFEALDEQSRVEIATRLGKGFDALIPLLSGGAAELERMIIVGRQLNPVTKQSAEEADKFNDSLIELKASGNAVWTQLASEALPALARIVGAMREAQKEGGTLKAVWVGIGGVMAEALSDVNTAPLNKLQKELASVNRQIESETKRLQSSLFETNSRAGIEVAIEAARTRKAQLEDEIKAMGDVIKTPAAPVPANNTMAQQVCEMTGGRWNGKSCERGAGAGAGAEDNTKKILDGQIKALERAGAEERDVLASNFKAIDAQLADSAISFADYYAVRRTLQEQAIKSQIAALDAEIVALEDYKNRASKTNDKLDAENKIADALQKRRALERAAGDQAVDEAARQKKSFEDLEKQIRLNNAAVQELEGSLSDAAAIRFDEANREIRLRLVVEGRDEAVAQLDRLRSYTVAQASINALNEEADRISQQRANSETLVSIAQRNGATTELGSLQARSEARAREVEELQRIYEVRLKIAQESGNRKLLQDAENLRVRIEELRASTDLLGQAFDNIFVGSAADAFASFATGAKSAKDAFNDFVGSVVSQISRLAAQDIAGSLFKGLGGGGGGGGGLLNLFSSFFGGGSGFAGQTAGGMFTLPGEGYAKGGAFTNGVVDTTTFFNPAMMGEAGPEAIMPLARDSSGRLGVRGNNGGSANVNITFNISTPDANSFRASESQISARMHAAVVAGMRNR